MCKTGDTVLVPSTSDTVQYRSDMAQSQLEHTLWDVITTKVIYALRDSQY